LIFIEEYEKNKIHIQYRQIIDNNQIIHNLNKLKKRSIVSILSNYIESKLIFVESNQIIQVNAYNYEIIKEIKIEDTIKCSAI